jgi:hypothetical protein
MQASLFAVGGLDYRPGQRADFLSIDQTPSPLDAYDGTRKHSAGTLVTAGMQLATPDLVVTEPNWN